MALLRIKHGLRLIQKKASGPDFILLIETLSRKKTLSHAFLKQPILDIPYHHKMAIPLLSSGEQSLRKAGLTFRISFDI